MPINWPRDLSYRRGSRTRLRGLGIHYDFEWQQVIEHNRLTFRGGQSLADVIRADCPEGKIPCLLLTELEGAELEEAKQHIRHDDDDYVVIVPIREYLREADADVASSYYARHSGARLTQLSSLSFSPAELEQFIDAQLTTEVLTGWIGRSANRIEILRGLVTPKTDSAVPVDVAGAIRALTAEDAGLLEEFISYIARVGGGTQFKQALEQITSFEAGRVAATVALDNRLANRMADIRAHLEEYNDLIANTASTETDVQHFIEKNPFIVGLTYVSAQPKKQIPRGELDFVLNRFDGFFDLVELKGPREKIIVEPTTSDSDRPPSASAYALSPALASALAQAHHYRSLLDMPVHLRTEYGLADTREPRILIVLGSSTALTASTEEILRQLNLSLHRVEVIPYDVLGTRTLGILNNLEKLLGATPPSEELQTDDVRTAFTEVGEGDMHIANATAKT